MSRAEALLERLEGVRRTGAGRWMARCPAHEDRRASLSVRELPDSRTLLHCFAGCETEAVLLAAGLTFDDLFPAPLTAHGRRERRPFNAHDVLEAVAFEALVVAVAVGNMRQGVPLTDEDHARLLQAAARLQQAAELTR